jgi:2-methylcitrate dehydratase PrpD
MTMGEDHLAERPNAISTTEPTAAERLGAFAAGVDARDLPASVQARAKELTLDLLGVAIYGATEPSSRAIRTLAAAAASPTGASAIGVTAPVAPAVAAMLNGTIAHAVELDDVTRESSLHPGVAVIPAALAAAEAADLDGPAFLGAVVVGYEVVIRVGNALNPASAYARGFHPTGVAGAFGAAAAAARLRGLDGARVAGALGVAGTMASGSLEYLSDGSWTKRLNAGWAAHVGIVAADLAAAGFNGPRTALEGRLGTLHAYSDAPNSKLLTEGLGASFQIERVAIKPYACCRYNHGLIDGILRLRAEGAANPSAIRRIRLGVLSAGALLVAHPIDQKRTPSNPVDAQFSAPFAAAVALLDGAAGPSQFQQDLIDDRRVRELMAITDCFTSPELDAEYPGEWPAIVEIELADGRLLSTRVEHALGEPENPLSTDAVRAKFGELVSERLGGPDASELEELVLGLDRVGSMRPLAAILRRVHAS